MSTCHKQPETLLQPANLTTWTDWIFRISMFRKALKRREAGSSSFVSEVGFQSRKRTSVRPKTCRLIARLGASRPKELGPTPRTDGEEWSSFIQIYSAARGDWRIMCCVRHEMSQCTWYYEHKNTGVVNSESSGKGQNSSLNTWQTTSWTPY